MCKIKHYDSTILMRKVYCEDHYVWEWHMGLWISNIRNYCIRLYRVFDWYVTNFRDCFSMYLSRKDQVTKIKWFYCGWIVADSGFRPPLSKRFFFYIPNEISLDKNFDQPEYAWLERLLKAVIIFLFFKVWIIHVFA